MRTMLMLALVLAGCARDSRPALEARAAGMTGRPVAELAAWLGVPEGALRREVAGEDTVLTWRTEWPASARNQLVFEEAPRDCTLAFTSRDGRVTGHRLAGEACGWAGLPGPLP